MGASTFGDWIGRWKQLKNWVLHRSDDVPESIVEGGFYYDNIKKKPMYFDGTEAKPMGGVSTAAEISCNPTGSIAATNVQDAIAELDAEKAVKNHASTTTDYGPGTADNFGHVQLVDTVSNGVMKAVTSNAVYDAIASVQPKPYVYAGSNGCTPGWLSGISMNIPKSVQYWDNQTIFCVRCWGDVSSASQWTARVMLSIKIQAGVPSYKLVVLDGDNYLGKIYGRYDQDANYHYFTPEFYIIPYGATQVDLEWGDVPTSFTGVYLASVPPNAVAATSFDNWLEKCDGSYSRVQLNSSTEKEGGYRSLCAPGMSRLNFMSKRETHASGLFNETLGKWLIFGCDTYIELQTPVAGSSVIISDGSNNYRLIKLTPYNDTNNVIESLNSNGGQNGLKILANHLEFSKGTRLVDRYVGSLGLVNPGNNIRLILGAHQDGYCFVSSTDDSGEYKPLYLNGSEVHLENQPTYVPTGGSTESGKKVANLEWVRGRTDGRGYTTTIGNGQVFTPTANQRYGVIRHTLSAMNQIICILLDNMVDFQQYRFDIAMMWQGGQRATFLYTNGNFYHDSGSSFGSFTIYPGTGRLGVTFVKEGSSIHVLMY